MYIAHDPTETYYPSTMGRRMSSVPLLTDITLLTDV